MIEREDPGEQPYTVFTNELLNDPILSAEALGVLVYLLSKPANWRVMPAELAKRFGCGRDRVYKILNALADAGYARRGQDRAEGGSFSNIKYMISSNKTPLPENTDAADLPHTDSPLPEKPTLQKKDSTKDRILQNGADDFFTEEPLPKKNKRRSTIPAEYPMTDRHKQYAAERGIANGYAAQVFENFKNHHAAKGTVMLDWDAAWRTWVGNEIKFNAGRNPQPPRQAPPKPGMIYGDDYM